MQIEHWRVRSRELTGRSALRRRSSLDCSAIYKEGGGGGGRGEDEVINHVRYITSNEMGRFSEVGEGGVFHPFKVFEETEGNHIQIESGWPTVRPRFEPVHKVQST